MLDRKNRRISSSNAKATKDSQEERDRYLTFMNRHQSMPAHKRPETPKEKPAISLGQVLCEIGNTVKDICKGLPVDPLPSPPPEKRDNSVLHAPNRARRLTPEEEEVSDSQSLC